MLRRHFGISAHEAKYVLPIWEKELLLRWFLRENEEEDEERPSRRPLGDPFAEVPPGLSGLVMH